MLAATAVAMLLTLDPMVAMAQSMCDAILRYGTFDQEGSFTSRQRFELVKNAFCKSTVSTLTSAKDVGVNLGVDVVGVVEAALGVSTSEANFQTNKDAFCALDYSKVQDNFTSETKIKRASEVIAKAWTTCVTQATGFVAWIVDHPQKTGFTINMQNNSAGSSQFDITALNFVPATGVTCSRKEQDATPARPIKILTRTATIGCTKPADQTIQVSMNTSVGTMPVVTVEGTTATLEDLRKRLAAIETFGANFPRGTIIAWFASSGAVPNGWAVCDGSNGTPDLRGRFVRGVATFADVKANAGGSERVQFMVREDDRNGSDFKWGETPWNSRPHPARGGQAFDIDVRPPFADLIFIMKL
jgi:hypothetical protein